MKLPLILPVLMILILSACRSERVDVRNLTPHDRALFAEAAAIEGVETTIHGRPGDWTVEYHPDMMLAAGNSDHIDTPDYFPFNPYCRIKINPNFLRTCETGSMDHYFKITVRHELRHCQPGGSGHSSNPDSLMFAPPPCFPAD